MTSINSVSLRTAIGTALSCFCLATGTAHAEQNTYNVTPVTQRESLVASTPDVIVSFSITTNSQNTQPAEDKFIQPNFPIQQVFLGNLLHDHLHEQNRPHFRGEGSTTRVEKPASPTMPDGYMTYRQAYTTENLFFNPELLFFRYDVKNLDDYLDMVTFLNNRFLYFLHDQSPKNDPYTEVPPLLDTPSSTLQTIWDQIDASCKANHNWQLDLTQFTQDLTSSGYPVQQVNELVNLATNLNHRVTTTCEYAPQTAQLMKSDAFSKFFDIFDARLVALQYRFYKAGKLRENPYYSFDQMLRVFDAYLQTLRSDDDFNKSWANYEALTFSKDASAFLNLDITSRKKARLAQLDKEKSALTPLIKTKNSE